MKFSGTPPRQRHIPLGWIVWLVGTIAATCTAFYMTRLMAMTFWGKEKFLDGGDEAHTLRLRRRLTRTTGHAR